MDSPVTRVVAWLAGWTWAATVAEAARVTAALGEAGELALLHVRDGEVEEALHGSYGGLLGRGARHRDPAGAVAELGEEAAEELLEAAARRVGSLARPVVRLVRSGRVEREVVAGCAGPALLVCARDGDHSRPGPASLGPQTRFVVDHAPCAVLLIWPDGAPETTALPPPPPPGGPPPPPPGHPPPP